MKYFPFENLKLKTKLGLEEVMDRLRQSIEPKKYIRIYSIFSDNNPKTKPYEGSLDGNEFSIQRIINGRNSFLPQITGTVTQGPGEMQVHVKMRLNAFVFMFMFFWCGGVGVAFITLLMQLIAAAEFRPVIFIPLFMFLAGYGMTLGFFKLESKKSKDFFIELLEAETIQTKHP